MEAWSAGVHSAAVYSVSPLTLRSYRKDQYFFDQWISRAARESKNLFTCEATRVAVCEYAVADPGFPSRAAEGDVNLSFGKCFAENCIEVKEIGPRKSRP